MALVVLISIWSWHTLRESSMAPPLPPIKVAGSGDPIAVVSSVAVGVAGDATTQPTGVAAVGVDNSSQAEPVSGVAAPSATVTPPQQPAATAQPAQALSAPLVHNSIPKTDAIVPKAEEPAAPSLLDRVLSTVLSLL